MSSWARCICPGRSPALWPSVDKKEATSKRPKEFPPIPSPARIVNAPGTPAREFLAILHDPPRESRPLSPEAPRCAPPDFQPRRPRLAPTAGACDCHAHILGPARVYPYSPARLYTPPDCLLPDYERMLDALGLARAVLVQPSVYG